MVEKIEVKRESNNTFDRKAYTAKVFILRDSAQDEPDGFNTVDDREEWITKQVKELKKLKVPEPRSRTKK